MRVKTVALNCSKIILLCAVFLSAAMLAFVGDTLAAPNTGHGSDTGTVIQMCVCRGSCRLVTMCLVNYCYSETVCDDCANCHAAQTSSRLSEGQKLCLSRKGNKCVTQFTNYRTGF